MRIKTTRGWMPLQTLCVPMPEAPAIYRGPLPSLAAEAFIAECEAAHVEWVERRAALLAEQHAEAA